MKHFVINSLKLLNFNTEIKQAKLANHVHVA